MAKEDFCFVYYDGDAARDKAHMTRLQRGAYDDLISAQRKFGHLSEKHIRMVLSKDYDECWPALEIILKVDENGMYYIEWVKKSVDKLISHSKMQKAKVEDYWRKKKQRNNNGNTTEEQLNQSGMALEVPLEDGDGIDKKLEPIGSEKVVGIAKKVWEDKIWREQICMGQSINPDDLRKWMAQFNASVANDIIPDFDVGSYRKMLQGWIAKQRANGRTVSAVANQSTGTPLKQL